MEHKLGNCLVLVNARPGDTDGDGDLDILAGFRGEARLILFRYEGTRLPTFIETPISLTNRSLPSKPGLPKQLSGMVPAFADLNSDGRLDIVTFETPWSVIWLEQKQTVTAQQFFFQAREQESRQIPMPPGFLQGVGDWLLQ